MSGIPDHRPLVPDRRRAIGIVGAGAIARSAHLPAYGAWGLPVVAVASRTRGDAEALATPRIVSSFFTGASSVAVTRYRYRGNTVPTPWTTKPAAAVTGS